VKKERESLAKITGRGFNTKTQGHYGKKESLSQSREERKGKRF